MAMDVERWLRANIEVPVRSSNVRTIRYDWSAKRLWVSFKGDALYWYGVGPDIAREQFEAMSHGKHVWKMRRAGIVGHNARRANKGVPKRRLRRR